LWASSTRSDHRKSSAWKLGDEHLECLNERGTGGLELCPMGQGKALEQALTASRDLNSDLPAVNRATASGDESRSDGSIDQLHDAVMAELEALRQDTYGRAQSIREALERQQQLMLLGLETGRARLALAEIQEAPYFMAQFCQGSITHER
jgi:hypothetical protein